MNTPRSVQAIVRGRFPQSQDQKNAFTQGIIRVHQGKIQETRISTDDVRSLVTGPTLDASDCVVLPGFIDVHIHGSAGADTMDASVEAHRTISRFLVRHGVTAYLPTTVTAAHETTLTAVQSVAQAGERPAPDGARILGVHLEGPYISPNFPGAQPKEHVRTPNLEEFTELIAAGPVRMITLAPEQPGGAELVALAAQAGIRTVIGHSEATYQQTVEAIDQGVSQATHTYNAMTGLHHRRPGVVGAVLSDDRIYAQLIADEIHVHPAAMKVLARCKGPDRTLLITDAIRAAGLPPGEYDLGGHPVYVQEGACRLADGTLAGSVATMDVCLRNFLKASGWSLEQGWPVTSLSPATALGLADRFGAIAPHYAADLVVLDEQMEVVATLVDGDLVFLRDAWRLVEGTGQS